MAYLLKLIEEGDHEQLDFKHSIDNMRKIAKTLVAFANTQGGRLLIGVKDNGKIKGCNLEEEKHMIEFSAETYCDPAVEYEFIEHTEEGKFVLEVLLPKSEGKIHQAIDENGKKKAFTRIKDEVILMPPQMFLSQKTKIKKSDNLFKYTEIENKIIKEIGYGDGVTIDEIASAIKIPRYELNKTLAKLINFNVVEMDYHNKIWYFYPVETN
jgi:predicted HTH transcriptional regulator